MFPAKKVDYINFGLPGCRVARLDLLIPPVGGASGNRSSESFLFCSRRSTGNGCCRYGNRKEADEVGFHPRLCALVYIRLPSDVGLCELTATVRQVSRDCLFFCRFIPELSESCSG